MRRTSFRLWMLTALTGLLVACSEVGYYAQCVTGQWHLLAQRRVIGEVIEDPATSPELRERLQTVMEIRDFASRELHLPENASYRTYADLNRPYAVWNVVATPELSLEPVTWCFPIAGCVPYRGYFDHNDAEAFARDLESKGYDVHHYGVPAYSTLTWFDDPVLNTFCLRAETDVAGLIFHELAHQKVYVKNDSAFNEAFAQSVELLGVERWLEAHGDRHQAQKYLEAYSREKDFVTLVLRARSRLAEIFSQPMSDDAKRSAKARTFDDFRREYAQLKDQQWGGFSGFDHWLKRPLNNAHFASISTYHTLVPAFQALFVRSRGNLDRFYREVADLGALEPDARKKMLAELLVESGELSRLAVEEKQGIPSGI